VCLFEDAASGFAIYFYWRITIESLQNFLDQAKENVHVNQSVLVLNNNIHQALQSGSSFQDPGSRYHDIKGIVEHAQRIWGPQKVFWRTPNRLRGSFARRPVDVGSFDSTNLTCADAAMIDGQVVASRLMAESLVPLIDAYKVTSQADDDECLDDIHFSNWELYHEVNIWLDQLNILEKSWYQWQIYDY
jgi:hypothetical protein